MSKDNFQWTDELVGEYGEWYRINQGKRSDLWGEDLLEYWKINVYKRKKDAHQIDIQNAVSMLVADGYEVIFPNTKAQPKEQVAKPDEKDWVIVKNITPSGAIHNPDDECNKGVPCKIHSVKRLSDSTTWSVDDDTRIGKIKKFELKDGIMYWWNEHTWYYFNQLEKLPEQKSKPIEKEEIQELIEKAKEKAKDLPKYKLESKPEKERIKVVHYKYSTGYSMLSLPPNITEENVIEIANAIEKSEAKSKEKPKPTMEHYTAVIRGMLLCGGWIA